MPTSRNQLNVSTGTDRLRTYRFHGLDLAPEGNQSLGDCPFCGREQKFSVNNGTGLYRCLVCGESGNPLIYTRTVYECAAVNGCTVVNSRIPSIGIDKGVNSIQPYSTDLGATAGRQPAGGTSTGRAGGGPAAADVGMPGAFAAAVAGDRRLLYPATAVAWGIRQATDGTWLVPGYGADGRLDQVYRRTRIQDKGKWVWRLLPTPGIWPEGRVHAIHLPAVDFDPTRPNLVVCEGPWDGMVLWEVWDRTSPNTNIIAVPGCNIWRDEWTQLCKGKSVLLMFDSDHPRELVPGSGRTSRAGYDGMARVAKRLSGVAASVRYLRWGPDGYDPTKPSGYDVRDFLCES